MGRKGSWFSAVKKALNPESKEKKDQKFKSKKKWLGKNKNVEEDYEENVDHLKNADHVENVDHVDHVVSSKEESAFVIPTSFAPPPPPPPLPTLPPIKEKLEEGEDSQRTSLALKEDFELLEAEDAQSKHVYSVAVATAMAAEAAVAAARAAAEVVRLTGLTHFPGKSLEEVAAIKIQTAFRGHLARRALRALRGLVRLKSLVEGQSVKRQATTTLKCMQTVARVQSEIRARRIRMSEENQALQRQIQQKQEKELKEMEKHRVASIGDNWNHSPQSKEEVEAKLQSRQEAAKRREKALAYSFSHQRMWKNSSKSQHPTFMDPSNPHWGWSWLERWMAARPWESQSTSDYNDRASLRSAASRASMSVAEITKAYALRDVHRDNKPPSPTGQKSSRPPSRQSPSALTKTPSSSWRTPKKNGSGRDEDSRSTYSVQSERFNRRHSIAGSSVRDDESLASTPSVPSSKRYLTPTSSTKTRSRLASPSSSGLEKNRTPTPDKGSSPSVSSVKKRLSYPASPAGRRRHSGPPRVGSSSPKGAAHTEKKVSNGWGSK
ncbi:putative IQ motif, EF-hand binding protein [Rosa chinensis]|uniref:Putative IQ motif, EF-hand binding protein n=1 Tax=Rosa chinensis TaxID=74649 RepID=A0A2P6SJM6_ROSCH|nr:protein IQ-DOMAIN 1 [Rosa chinensis]PRQ58874.1 putative IQ motif, EF-hand binding protein [Rosa chinensis]